MLALTDEQINVIRNGYKRVQVTVSFPFDNTPDITNEQIVYESLSFNESVCSSDVFRFGNAEASTVSFETVGVGNILGKVIDVKLTYEYILPEDPTNVRTFDLPYGRFTVTSCPRNHENMAHRQVQATSRTSDTNDEIMPQVEKNKLRIMRTTDANYEPNAHNLLDSMFGFSREYTDSEFCSLTNYRSTSHNTGDYTLGYSGNYRYFVRLDRTTASSKDVSDCLYSLSATYDSSYVDQIDQIMNTYDWSSVNDVDEIRAYAAFKTNSNQITSTSGTKDAFWYLGAETMERMYPYVNRSNRTWFLYPISIGLKLYRIQYSGGSGSYTEELIQNYGTFYPYTALTVTEHVPTIDSMELYLSINSTLHTTSRTYGDLYSFVNSYDASELATGFAELHAGFNRQNRDGTGTIIRLNNSNPYPLTASDVEGQAWWDEYNIADIGSIKYCWTDGKGDHEGEYTWNPDGSVYDMTDNGLFKNIKLRVKTVSAVSKMTDPTMYYIYSGNWYAYNGTAFVQMGVYESKSSIIEYMLDTFFLPYADIHFTPIDMNIRGLPFLQCGDAITFTAADGTVINSYILNHTFSGIQHITENIDTVQGEVLS